MFRAVVLLTLALTTACSSWIPASGPPQVVIPDERPEVVRLHLPDDATVTLRDPKLSGDSLSGWLDTRGQGGSIALQDVRSMEVRVTDVRKTVGLVVLIPVVFVAGLIVVGQIVCRGGENPSGFC